MNSVNLQAEQEIFEEEGPPKVTIDGRTYHRMGKTKLNLDVKKAFRTLSPFSKITCLFPGRDAIIYGSKKQKLSFSLDAGFVNTTLLLKSDIVRKLSKMRSLERSDINVHIGGVQIIITVPFIEAVDWSTSMDVALIDNKKNETRGTTLGIVQGDLDSGKLAFFIYPKLVVSLNDWHFNGTLSLAHKLSIQEYVLCFRKGKITQPDKYHIRYKVVYALSDSHDDDIFRDNDCFEV